MKDLWSLQKFSASFEDFLISELHITSLFWKFRQHPLISFQYGVYLVAFYACYFHIALVSTFNRSSRCSQPSCYWSWICSSSGYNIACKHYPKTPNSQADSYRKTQPISNSQILDMQPLPSELWDSRPLNLRWTIAPQAFKMDHMAKFVLKQTHSGTMRPWPMHHLVQLRARTVYFSM
jgi:hypothetical protein